MKTQGVAGRRLRAERQGQRLHVRWLLLVPWLSGTFDIAISYCIITRFCELVVAARQRLAAIIT